MNRHINRRAALKYVGGSAAALLGQEMLARVGFASTQTPQNALLNQVGYLPASAKIASVPLQEGERLGFQVIPEHRGKPVLQGTLTAARLDDASGDRVALADF